jgi:DNA polymerase III delta prime subunit
MAQYNLQPTPGQNELWQEKYRPRTLNDYISLNDYQKAIDTWWVPFDKYNKAYAKYKAAAAKPIKGKRKTPLQPPDKIAQLPFLILYGEPGTGKTTLAHCIFSALNYDVIEINSSDSRNKKLLSELIETGKRSVVFTEDGNKELGLIMDELDGLTDGESGGATTLVDLTVIKDLGSGNLQVRYPVICTTNSIKEKKLKQIMDLGVLINIKQPGPIELNKLAAQINISESIGLSHEEITILANKSARDYRKLIDTMYQIYLAHDRHRELQNIISNIEAFNQLSQYTNLPIQEVTGHLVSHKPHGGNTVKEIRHFCNELESFFYTDSQLFYINLLDNYPGILEQLFAAAFLKDDTPHAKYKLFLNTLDYMTQNYLVTDPYNAWEKTHVDSDSIISNKYIFQDYTVLSALYANFKLLNTINNTWLQSPLTHVNTVYHSKYNNKKTDAGYYNNNMINFVKKQPGSQFTFMNDVFSGDIELLLLAKKSTIPALKSFVIGNTRHTTNLIKKIKNSFALANAE